MKTLTPEAKPDFEIKTKSKVNSSRRELIGENLPPTSSEASTCDPSEPSSGTGSETPHSEEPDEQEKNERLIEEGVEEAQHAQMPAARRRARKEIGHSRLHRPWLPTSVCAKPAGLEDALRTDTCRSQKPARTACGAPP